MDQVFAVRQVCEKYFANGKDVFWAFMDLEKVYGTIDRHGMWQMLKVYGVGGKLLRAVQSFHVDSRACVRVSLVKFARKKKLRVNVGKSKVMRCSRYGNGDRMHVILNGEPLFWIVLSTWGRKWQPMEDVKGMWCT